MAIGSHLLIELWNETLVDPALRRRGNVLIARHVPSDVVLDIGTIGHVIIDQEIGHPGIEDLEPGAHLGRVGFDVIPIEVEALRGVAQSGQSRSALAHAMKRAELIVPIDVEDGDDDEDRLIEPCRMGLRHGHIADEHQDCIFAFDFARVNAALDHDDGFAGLCGGFRREGAVFRDDERDSLAAFGRGADFDHFDEA